MKKIIILIIAMTSTTITFAQKTGKKDTVQHFKLYTCPMHDTVAMKKPGNCPICGMKLELSNKEQMKMEVTKTYTCPMHPQEVSDKPGKCSKCGMSLMLSSKEKMKTGVVNNYTCPMHSDVTSDKPGKCSKCGMALTEVKDTEKHN
jgi:transcription initiation factor IIE alpha subunit